MWLVGLVDLQSFFFTCKFCCCCCRFPRHSAPTPIDLSLASKPNLPFHMKTLLSAPQVLAFVIALVATTSSAYTLTQVFNVDANINPGDYNVVDVKTLENGNIVACSKYLSGGDQFPTFSIHSPNNGSAVVSQSQFNPAQTQPDAVESCTAIAGSNFIGQGTAGGSWPMDAYIEEINAAGVSQGLTTFPYKSSATATTSSLASVSTAVSATCGSTLRPTSFFRR